MGYQPLRPRGPLCGSLTAYHPVLARMSQNQSRSSVELNLAADTAIPGFGPDRCSAYLDATKDAPIRDLLIRALGLVAAHSRALDIGCGPGREIVAMLQHGLSVQALDPSREMITQARMHVSASFPSPEAHRVVFHHATIESIAPLLEHGSFGLVHAGFVLPFIRAADFPATFAHIRRSLAPGGLLVAQFFGPDDAFIRETGHDDMTAHSAADLDRLLAGLELLHREEVNRSGFIGKGRVKWWHVHHVIARAPADG